MNNKSRVAISVATLLFLIPACGNDGSWRRDPAEDAEWVKGSKSNEEVYCIFDDEGDNATCDWEHPRTVDE